METTTTAVWDGLFIGGLLAYSEVDRLREFNLVMNVAWEFSRDERGKRKPTEVLANGVRVYHGWLDDNDDPEGQASHIQEAVDQVSKARAQGGTCLVTCYEGRNRSALVIAEHLIQRGEDPDTVISQIQKLRHKALTNKAFVEWLRRQR